MIAPATLMNLWKESTMLMWLLEKAIKKKKADATESLASLSTDSKRATASAHTPSEATVPAAPSMKNGYLPSTLVVPSARCIRVFFVSLAVPQLFGWRLLHGRSRRSRLPPPPLWQSRPPPWHSASSPGLMRAGKKIWATVPSLSTTRHRPSSLANSCSWQPLTLQLTIPGN